MDSRRHASLREAWAASRHRRDGSSGSRRQRLVRPADVQALTYEGRIWPRDDDFHEDEEDEEEDRPRHAKRRKLDQGSHSSLSKRTKYGRYGQVEPGRLKMEIYSCDGGVFDERGVVNFGPSNILAHDQSVYRSNSAQCNIILQHYDRSPFTLEELIIIAPESGFTSPLAAPVMPIKMIAG